MWNDLVSYSSLVTLVDGSDRLKAVLFMFLSYPEVRYHSSLIFSVHKWLSEIPVLQAST